MVSDAGLELQLFFRQFLHVNARGDVLEGMFNLLYGMNGGMTWQDLKTMRRRDFEWFLKRLSDQKERENKEIERVRGQGTKTGTGAMKYLGR